jgi:PTS system mannose-specific IID component
MKRGLMRSGLRTLLVQASWNYERLVGIGVAFAMEPMLRDLPEGVTGSRYRAALGRAAHYFNGHPYLLGLAVGALARVEHDGLPPQQIARLRTALAGPLGSVGDKLVWAGLLPVASAVGLVLAVWSSPAAAVVGFLALYNIVHFSLRGWALKSGWSHGIAVGRRLGARTFKLGLKVAGPLAAVTVGFALPVAAAWLVRHLDLNELTGVGLIAGVGVVFARWIWPTLGANRFGLAAVAVALILGWV